MDEVLIEHSGSSYHNKVAQKMQTTLEHKFNCDVEQVVGADTDTINLYNRKNMEEIGSFSAMPKQETLRLHLSLML